ncbi:uncharacterized protein LOC113310509 [Papaver somniferum]|uniref:uncharacterized protein LOC113310509 n=1 Tax=Papaver somniferum TaxID=3469 RepID=UPI000E6FC718|nr:uncharacterized protein LOC113310509 [Papaver somniferum]
MAYYKDNFVLVANGNTGDGDNPFGKIFRLDIVSLKSKGVRSQNLASDKDSYLCFNLTGGVFDRGRYIELMKRDSYFNGDYKFYVVAINLYEPVLKDKYQLALFLANLIGIILTKEGGIGDTCKRLAQNLQQGAVLYTILPLPIPNGSHYWKVQELFYALHHTGRWSWSGDIGSLILHLRCGLLNFWVTHSVLHRSGKVPRLLDKMNVHVAGSLRRVVARKTPLKELRYLQRFLLSILTVEKGHISFSEILHVLLHTEVYGSLSLRERAIMTVGYSIWSCFYSFYCAQHLDSGCEQRMNIYKCACSQHSQLCYTYTWGIVCQPEENNICLDCVWARTVGTQYILTMLHILWREFTFLAVFKFSRIVFFLYFYFLLAEACESFSIAVWYSILIGVHECVSRKVRSVALSCDAEGTFRSNVFFKDEVSNPLASTFMGLPSRHLAAASELFSMGNDTVILGGGYWLFDRGKWSASILWLSHSKSWSCPSTSKDFDKTIKAHVQQRGTKGATDVEA